LQNYKSIIGSQTEERGLFVAESEPKSAAEKSRMALPEKPTKSASGCSSDGKI